MSDTYSTTLTCIPGNHSAPGTVGNPEAISSTFVTYLISSTGAIVKQTGVNNLSVSVAPSSGPPACEQLDLANTLLFEPKGEYVYVPYGQTIYTLSIDSATGALVDNKSKEVATGQISGVSAIAPSGTFIFANNGGKILTYEVNPSASIVELAPVDANGAGNYGAPIVDASGKYVYLVVTPPCPTTDPNFPNCAFTSAEQAYTINSSITAQNNSSAAVLQADGSPVQISDGSVAVIQ